MAGGYRRLSARLPRQLAASQRISVGTACKTAPMAVRQDCRHYSTRTTPAGDVVQRCRVEANETAPFACPEGCLFFEDRPISEPGWKRFGTGE